MAVGLTYEDDDDPIYKTSAQARAALPAYGVPKGITPPPRMAIPPPVNAPDRAATGPSVDPMEAAGFTRAAFDVAPPGSKTAPREQTLSPEMLAAGFTPVTFDVARPPNQTGEFMGGLQQQWLGTKGMAYGALRAGAHTLGAEGVEKWAGEKAADTEKQQEEVATPSSSLSDVMAGKEGTSWLGFLKNSAGNLTEIVGEGLVTSAATAAIGAMGGPVGAAAGGVGGFIAGTANAIARNGLFKTMAGRAISFEAKNLAKTAEIQGLKLTEEEIANQAAANVARYAVIGGAMSGTKSSALEIGGIMNDAAEQSEKTGKPIDMAKVYGYGLGAGMADVAGEAFGLSRLLKVGKGKSRLSNAARSLVSSSLVEGGTEGLQTVLEEIGAGTQDWNSAFTDPDARRALIDSIGKGAAIGGIGGALAGATHKGKGLQKEAAPPSEIGGLPEENVPDVTLGNKQTGVAPETRQIGYYGPPTAEQYANQPTPPPSLDQRRAAEEGRLRGLQESGVVTGRDPNDVTRPAGAISEAHDNGESTGNSRADVAHAIAEMTGAAQGVLDTMKHGGPQPIFGTIAKAKQETESGMATARKAQGLQPPTAAAPAKSFDTMATTPEPQADLQAQMDALLDPNHPKDAVFVAKGTPLPTLGAGKKPSNLSIIKKPDGTYITTNPAKARAITGKTKITTDDRAAFLSIPEGKEAVASQTAEPLAVQAKDAAGNVVMEAATPPTGPNIPAVAAQTPEGGTTEVTTPQQVLEDRQAKVEEEATPALVAPTAPAEPPAATAAKAVSKRIAARKGAAPVAAPAAAPAPVTQAAPEPATPTADQQFIADKARALEKFWAKLPDNLKAMVEKTVAAWKKVLDVEGDIPAGLQGAFTRAHNKLTAAIEPLLPNGITVDNLLNWHEKIGAYGALAEWEARNFTIPVTGTKAEAAPAAPPVTAAKTPEHVLRDKANDLDLTWESLPKKVQTLAAKALDARRQDDALGDEQSAAAAEKAEKAFYKAVDGLLPHGVTPQEALDWYGGTGEFLGLGESDAVQEPSAAGVLQQEPGEAGEGGGKRGGVEPKQQGEKPATESKADTEKAGTGKVAEPNVVIEGTDSNGAPAKLLVWSDGSKISRAEVHHEDGTIIPVATKRKDTLDTIVSKVEDDFAPTQDSGKEEGEKKKLTKAEEKAQEQEKRDEQEKERNASLKALRRTIRQKIGKVSARAIAPNATREEREAFVNKALAGEYGLEKSVTLIDTPEPWRRMTQVLAKMLGQNVQFFSPATREVDAATNGFKVAGDPDTVYVSVNTNRPEMFVFGHEIGHNIRELNPKLWTNFMETMVGLADRDVFKKYTRNLTEKLNAEAKRQGKARPDKSTIGAIVQDETSADALGEAFMSKEFWDLLYRSVNNETKPLVLRMLEEVAAIIRQFGAAMKALAFADPNIKKAPTDRMYKDVLQLHREVRDLLIEFRKSGMSSHELHDDAAVMWNDTMYDPDAVGHHQWEDMPQKAQDVWVEFYDLYRDGDITFEQLQRDFVNLNVTQSRNERTDKLAEARSQTDMRTVAQNIWNDKLATKKSDPDFEDLSNDHKNHFIRAVYNKQEPIAAFDQIIKWRKEEETSQTAEQKRVAKLEKEKAKADAKTAKEEAARAEERAQQAADKRAADLVEKEQLAIAKRVTLESMSARDLQIIAKYFKVADVTDKEIAGLRKIVSNVLAGVTKVSSLPTNIRSVVNHAIGGEKFLRARTDENSIVQGANEIAAMTPSVRDDTEYANMPGGYRAHQLWEARKLLPKPSDKLKRVTHSNSNSLPEDHSFIANVDGVLYGVSKQEDPDATSEDEDKYGDPKEFIYSYSRLDNPDVSVNTTISDEAELIAEIEANQQKVSHSRKDDPGFVSYEPIVAPTDTKAFNNWFRDSKVEDPSGPTLLWHHGSFTEDGDYTPNGPMHFGTRRAAEDRAYGKRIDDRVAGVTAFKTEDGKWHWHLDDGMSSADLDDSPGFQSEERALMFGRNEARAIEENGYESSEDTGAMTGAYLSIKNPKRVRDVGQDGWAEEIAKAKAEGHDGIVYRNRFEDIGSDSWIAFEPGQIKSMNNYGTFDRTNSDIRYSRKGLAENIPTEQEAAVHAAAKFLTLPEAERLYKKGGGITQIAHSFLTSMGKMPDPNEMAAVAFAGRAKRGWYQQSMKAIHEVFGVDGPRFAAFLAALSPQTSVESNLMNTLKAWKAWVAEGRPTDQDSIERILGETVQKSPLYARPTESLKKLAGKLGLDATGNRKALVDRLTEFQRASTANAQRVDRNSVLDAWVNNAVRALSTPTPTADVLLSGPKVNSFFRNLIGDMMQVTNDAWMAAYALVDQKIFGGSLNTAGDESGKGHGYLAMNVAARKAAAILTKRTGETWTPAEVQETIWSWAKTLYELQERRGESRDAVGLLKDKALTDDLIRSTPDFRSLFADANLPYQRILLDAGYREGVKTLARNNAIADAAAKKAAKQGPAVETVPFADAAQARYERQAAERLAALYELRLNDERMKTAAPSTSRGINIEVAPDPRDKALTERFNAMTEDQKARVTERVAEQTIPAVLEEMGIKTGYQVEYTVGGFQGNTQPSIVVRFDDSISFETMTEAGKVLGHVFQQQAIISYDETQEKGGTQTGFLKVEPSRVLTYGEQSTLFKKITERFPEAAGFTGRDGALVFGNFSGMPDAMFLYRMQQALSKIKIRGVDVTIAMKTFRSEWVEPVTLEGTRYESKPTQDAAGGDVLRGQGRIAAIREQAQSHIAEITGNPAEGPESEVTRASVSFSRKDLLNPVEVYALKGDKVVGMATYNVPNQQWFIFKALPGGDIRSDYTEHFAATPQEAMDALREKGVRLVRRKESPLMQGQHDVWARGPDALFHIDTSPQKAKNWFVRGIDKTLAQVGVKGSDVRRFLQRESQDNYIDLKAAQEDIVRKGGIIDASRNVYQKLTLFSGKIGAQMDTFRREFADPMMKHVESALRKGATLKDFDRFLIAQHAEERNEMILQRTNGKKQDGSGITTDEANRRLAAYAASPYYAELVAIGKIADDISAFKVDLMEKSRLIDADTAAGLRHYKHYRPLKNLDPDDTGEITHGIGVGRGFSGKASLLQYALGRDKEADHTISHLLLDAEAKIVRAGKNEVGLSLADLAEQFPDPHFWVVNPMKATKHFDPETGTIRYQADNGQMNPQSLVAFRDGVPIRVDMKEPSFAAAINNSRAGGDGYVLNALRKWNKYLSTMITSLNPEWLLINASRDAQTAFFNISADKNLPPGMGRKVVAQLANLGGHKDIYKAITDPNHPSGMGKWYKDLEEQGGITKFFDMHTLEDRAKKLADLEQRITGKNTLKGKVLSYYENSYADKAVTWLQDVNSAVEAAPRVASYKVLVEAGWSKADASDYVKNLTTNFDRKGANPYLRAGYLFFNPSVQGTMRLAQALNTPQGKMIAGGLFAMGAAASLTGNSAGDEDKNGIPDYQQLSDFDRATNVIIWPHGPKVPLPYGWNAFYAAGNFAMDTLFGKSVTSAGWNMVKAAQNAFNPFGSDSKSVQGWLAKSITPTAMDPLLGLVMNENQFGSDIARKQNTTFGPKQPDSQMGRGATTDTSKFIAKTLNAATRGSATTSGGIDINPDVIDYLAGQVAPGVLSTAHRTAVSVAKATSGASTETREWPFIRRVTAEPSKSVTYEELQKAKDNLGELLNVQKNGDSQERSQMAREHPGWAGVAATFSGLGKQAGALQKRKAGIIDGKIKVSDEVAETEKIDKKVEELNNRMLRTYKSVSANW